MQCKVTPEMFWSFRRAQLGGKSAVTNTELPRTLDECNPAVQADHYAQACYAFASYQLIRAVDDLSTANLASIPIPPHVAIEDVSEIQNRVIKQVLLDHGIA